MPSLIDRIGKTYGRLTVVARASDPSKKVQWLCRCSCGGSKVVNSCALQTGHVESCGCLRTENAKRVGHMNTKHGHAHPKSPSRTYRSWSAMWRRCTNQNGHAYQRYGGRGITVCTEWENFERFLADMGERPADRSIDRIDNDKGYFKDNCRWATRSEQQWNRSGYGNSATKRN